MKKILLATTIGMTLVLSSVSFVSADRVRVNLSERRVVVTDPFHSVVVDGKTHSVDVKGLFDSVSVNTDGVKVADLFHLIDIGF